jgi:Fe-S-cluster containining protein
MAIFDSPDGSIDPRPRCTGHCCRCFSTDFSYEEAQADFLVWKKNPAESKLPNIEIVAPMLIPLGKIRGQEIFTCKHLGKDGNCMIYETRPQICRDFPGPTPCTYRNCASHGPQPWWRKAMHWILE